MKNVYTSNSRKGFTLVELLAVIVILAIIMIIAIPSVLSTMNTAKRKAFDEYIDKVASGAQKKLTSDELIGKSVTGCVIYDIKNDLDFSSTGDFEGYVLINSNTNEIYVSLHDNEYYVSSLRYGDSIDDNIKQYVNNSDVRDELSQHYLCDNVNGCMVCKAKDPESGDIKEQTDTKKDGGLLLPGQQFNISLKDLVGNKTGSDYRDYESKVKEIRYSSTANTEGVVVSVEDSPYPIYASFDESSGVLTLSSNASKIYLNSDSRFALGGFTKVTYIDFDHIDCSKVTNAYNMFVKNESITSLDLNIFKNSKLTNMGGMFQVMTSLKSLDLSPLDTSRVTNMSATFNGLRVTSLDVSTLDTSNVTDMSYMFNGLRNVTTLDLSNFNTSKVTDMGCMFYGDINLTSINLSSFDTSRVTIMTGMFHNCQKLKTIDLSKFYLKNVEDPKMMFMYCYALENVNRDVFDFENADTMYGVFADCRKLKKINLSGFRNTKEVDFAVTFGNCYAATEINISGFTNPRFDSTFLYCKVVNVIYVSSEYTGSLTFSNTGCKIKTLTKI